MIQFFHSKFIKLFIGGLLLASIILLLIGAANERPAEPLRSTGGFFGPFGVLWIGDGNNYLDTRTGVGLTNYIEFRKTNSLALQPDFCVGTNGLTYINNGVIVNAITNKSGAIQTNWVSGLLYTNTSAGDWFVRVSSKVTTAAVTGDAAMRLQTGTQGSSLTTLSAQEMQTTVAVTISMVYTNEICGFIPAGNVFTFTNLSSGAGNSGALNAGTGQLKQF